MNQELTLRWLHDVPASHSHFFTSEKVLFSFQIALTNVRSFRLSLKFEQVEGKLF